MIDWKGLNYLETGQHKHPLLVMDQDNRLLKTIFAPPIATSGSCCGPGPFGYFSFLPDPKEVVDQDIRLFKIISVPPIAKFESGCGPGHLAT